MRPFAFRQRVGDVNWRAVSSVDVERVVDECRVEELQAVIDEVTFCDVKSSDIKGNTIQSTKKLVQLMQLMLEYLLYCQESQLTLVQDLYQKNKNMKNQNKLLSQKNISAKEDIRIYRRQIALMKESMKSLDVKEKTVEQPPRVFDPLNNEGKGNGNGSGGVDNLSPLIDSMLQHERETRNFVKEIIHEQRNSFLTEFEKISTKVQQGSGRTNSLTAEDIEHKLQLNMDRILSELRKSQYTRQESDNTKDALDMLEGERKKLRDYERQLERREDKLTLREDKLVEGEERLSQLQKEIQDRTHDLDMRALEMRNSVRGSGDTPKPIVPQRSVGVNTEPMTEEISVSNPNNAVAFNMLMRIFKRGSKDKCQFAFVHWKNFAHHQRQQLHEKDMFSLRTMNDSQLSELEQLREQNQALQAQVQSEREKNLIESARMNTLSRKLKEFEVAKIMAVQTDACVNTSVDNIALHKRHHVEVVETEEQMMDIARQRIAAHLIDPDMAAIVETLATEICQETAAADLEKNA